MLALQIGAAALLLIAYWCRQVEWWRDTDVGFLALNIVGSGLLAALAWIEGQIGFALINSVWCWVASYTAGRRTWYWLRHNRA